MDHKPTNNKARPNQTFQNQNTPHHLPRKLPQHPKQLPRPPPHLYRWIKQGMKVGCAAVFQNQELLKRLPNE